MAEHQGDNNNLKDPGSDRGLQSDLSREQEESAHYIPSAAERQSWEFRKLQAEVHKLGLDAELVRRNTKTQLVVSIVPAITTLIAVAGLLFNINSQRIQDERTAQNRRDDEYATLVRQLTQDRTQAQIGVTNLRSFWEDSKYHDRTLELLLSIISAERNPIVREGIRALVITNADQSTLAALAAQNRFIVKLLAQQSGQDSIQFATWRNRPKSTVPPPQFDKAQEEALDDLGWNIETIIVVMNKLRTIRNADLSFVTLSRPSLIGQLGVNYSLTDLDKIELDKEIVFENVNLNNANLATRRFEEVTFRNTGLNNAQLAQTTFLGCHFEGKTSIRNFSVYLTAKSDKYPNGVDWIFPATWENCTLDVAAFCPSIDPEYAIMKSGDSYFYFQKCTWQIRGQCKTKDEHYQKEVMVPLDGKEASLEWNRQVADEKPFRPLRTLP